MGSGMVDVRRVSDFSLYSNPSSDKELQVLGRDSGRNLGTIQS